jgi:hypothetical protein
MVARTERLSDTSLAFAPECALPEGSRPPQQASGDNLKYHAARPDAGCGVQLRAHAPRALETGAKIEEQE